MALNAEKATNTKQNNSVDNAESSPYFQFRNKPLVQCGDMIYYGHMADEYVVLLQVISRKPKDAVPEHTAEEDASPVALTIDRVVVKLMRTDATLNPLEQIVKTSEKQGIYTALDLASVWLHEALKES